MQFLHELAETFRKSIFHVLGVSGNPELMHPGTHFHKPSFNYVAQTGYRRENQLSW